MQLTRCRIHKPSLNPCGFCFAEAHMVHFTTGCRFHICIRGKHFIISSSVTCQSKQPKIFQVNKSPLNENSRGNYVTNCSSHYVCWQFVAARTRKLWWEKLMTTSTVVLIQTRWQFKRKLSVQHNDFLVHIHNCTQQLCESRNGFFRIRCFKFWEFKSKVL